MLPSMDCTAPSHDGREGKIGEGKGREGRGGEGNGREGKGGERRGGEGKCQSPLTLSRLANTGIYDRELTATAKAALFVFTWRGSVD